MIQIPDKVAMLYESSPFMAKIKASSFGLLLILALSASGCDQMITPRNVQIVRDADRKASQGDYLRAINLYEAALDDSPSCADIHYKLALLYDDKMNDPLNALHHFKRYLMVNPTGPRASDVKNFMKRDEISLATTLSGDAIVTRAEAVRLKNENLNLRKDIEERVLKSRSAEKAEARDSKLEKAGRKTGERSYVVQSGDTLFSISRKFYKSSHRWREIRDANKNKIGDAGKLKPGESLTIP